MSRRSRSKEDWWKYIPACIWWTLWKERNERSFDGQASSIQKILMKNLSLLMPYGVVNPTSSVVT
ncbi:hypothetical protein H5410_033624 [Solanum commersonii]|uniref:Uncharacterized protein n=1 Tax=Solanum commersonii TaxID=4109 RepID=A0A9J5YTM8_SOLCO|nr:hypothetical protein H5410_033624 [Solanum commersonii]